MENDLRTAALSDSTLLCRVAFRRFLDMGREENGAALVITLAVFFLMYLAIMGVFAVSTAVKERIHLQNACDAAAYSAAVVQADTLSRIATINRAMSWTYVQMTRRQMDYIVLRWLTHTSKHYWIDHDGADRYNKEGFFHGPCDTHGSIRVGWFIGTNPADMSTAMRVRLNGLAVGTYLGADAMPGAEVTSLLNLGSTPTIQEVDLALSSFGTLTAFEEIRDSGLFSKPTGKRESGEDKDWNDYEIEDNAVSVRDWIRKSAGDIPSNIETVDSVDMMWEQLGGVNNNKYEGAGNDCERLLQAQIVQDRLNIALMNISERLLVRQMTRQIALTVKDVIAANIPTNIANNCSYYLGQNEDPLDGEMTGEGYGYFVNLYNTKADEQRFLRFAGYTDKLVDVYMNAHSDEQTESRTFAVDGDLGVDNITYKVKDTEYKFQKKVLSRVASGVNQWFVRGGTRRGSNGEIKIGRTGENSRGLQRCYKHWAEGPFANIHATHSPLPPSCWNTDSGYLEGSPATVALYSEWAWWSDVWCCPKILWKRRHWHPWPHKSKFWPMKMECSHNDRPGLFGTAELKDSVKAIQDLSKSAEDIENLVKGVFEGRKDKNGNKIALTEENYAEGTPDTKKLDGEIDSKLSDYAKYEGDENKYTSGKKENLSKFSESGINSFEDGCLMTLPVLNLTDHVVGFGRLYADAPQIYNSCYVGERAKPLILSKRYFGKAGTISVGIRRRNENVFMRILGKIEGIFAAFDPDWGDGGGTPTFVFASAKAGYKYKGEGVSSRAYKVHWEPENQEWNLCQSDWDAVFVPVRKAYSDASTGLWNEGDEGMLKEWIVYDADKWMPVAGNGGGDMTCGTIEAPVGILRGNGHYGKLDWEGLSHVMYH